MKIKDWFKTRKKVLLGIVHAKRLSLSKRFNLLLLSDFLILTPLHVISRLTIGKARARTFYNWLFKKLFPNPIFTLPDGGGEIKIERRSEILQLLEIAARDIYSAKDISSGDVVIDVGANIGVYVIVAAEKVGPQGGVIAIEPEPRNFRKLKENIRRNNIQNVTPLKIALSDENKETQFYIHDTPEAHSLTKKSEESIRVKVFTLDRILEKFNISPEVIKIDAEGVEMKILEGGNHTLKNKDELSLIIECGHYEGQGEEVREQLNNFDFRIVQKDDLVFTSRF